MNPFKAFFRTLGHLVSGRLNFPRDRVGEIICSLSLFALLMAQIVHAEPANPVLDTAALNAFVEEQMDRHRIPGLAVAITHGEDIGYLRALGTAGSGRAHNPQTPLYIGSVSKSFTALAVMQLVEAGKLDLDAPVQTYLPRFAVADDAASKTITVRHLLNQTSGFARRDHTNEALPQDATLQDAVLCFIQSTLFHIVMHGQLRSTWMPAFKTKPE